MAAPPLQALDEGAWRLDCLGLLCPVPVIRAGQAARKLPSGAILEVLADDPGAELDLQDWCAANRHELLEQRREGSTWITRLRRR